MSSKYILLESRDLKLCFTSTGYSPIMGYRTLASSVVERSGNICATWILSIRSPSRKHAYIILTPLHPTFIYGKTGVYRGIYYFFLFLLKNIDCGYSLEPPCRGGSNEYQQSML